MSIIRYLKSVKVKLYGLYGRFSVGYASFVQFLLRRNKSDTLGDARVTIPVYTAEQRRVLLGALATHPGFQLLAGEFHNRRLGFERQLAEKIADCTLKGDLADFREIARLQEAAFAWGWFQRQVQRATQIEQYLAAHAVASANAETSLSSQRT